MKIITTYNVGDVMWHINYEEKGSERLTIYSEEIKAIHVDESGIWYEEEYGGRYDASEIYHSYMEALVAAMRMAREKSKLKALEE